MKLKIKLPLLFLSTSILIIVSCALYLSSLIVDENPSWLKSISSPTHIKVLLFLIIITGFMFLVLAVYLNFNITKPIQILNLRLKSISFRHVLTSIYSKRKDEIGELYNHFDEMEKRLHQAHKEQVDMIAAITHDLKTPLTTINGFVELLAMQKDLSDREKQEYYELILKKSKHIVELINGFSSFAKDELELESIGMKPMDVLKLFESIVGEYETELSGLDYELIWDHSFNANQQIMINEHMIRRVFGNLFSNSVRYGENKELKVYLNGSIHDGFAHFQVEDNGVGVPDQDLPSLFLKFFTVDKSRQSKIGGTGLGLASCKSIIEHHGGEICAFHSEHGGLGIRFTLPLI